MKYFLVFALSFCAVWASAAAIDDLHRTTAEDISATEYYEQVTKGDPNAKSTDIKNKQGEAEIKRAAVSTNFDTESRKTAVKKAGKAKIKQYVVKDNNGNSVTIDNKTKNIPAASAPASVSGGDTDALLLQSLGTQTSSEYKGNYETAVGSKKESNLDMTENLEAAKQEQAAADKKFADSNRTEQKTSANDDTAAKMLGGIATAILGGGQSGSAAASTDGNPNSSASACRSFCKNKGFGSYQYNAHPPAGWSRCGCV